VLFIEYGLCFFKSHVDFTLMEPKTIIFIGPQGSGKGTQIERLSKALKTQDPERRVVDIQTGRRFRSLAAKQEGYTEKEIHRTLDTGVLQPLFLSVVLWGDAFHHHVDPDVHLLIDGLPRTIHEAHVLESALTFYRRDPLIVIHLDTPEAVVRERMIERARPDDTPESIEARLAWYTNETVPVVKYYRTRPSTTVIDIDGTHTIDAVTEAIHTRIL
jgi:adenylate kinase